MHTNRQTADSYRAAFWMGVIALGMMVGIVIAQKFGYLPQ